MTFYFCVSPCYIFYLLKWQSRFFFFLLLSFSCFVPFFILLFVSITLHLSHIPPLCHQENRIPIWTSNHKIEKTKTPTWTYLHTKKNQNPHKKHQTISIVTTNLNMKARKTKSILFGGFHWKKCKSSPLLRKWPCIATTFVGPIVGKTQAIKPYDLVPISNAPRFFAASTTHIFSFVASILLHYTSLPSSSLTSWINDGDGDGCWFCSYGAKAMRSKERSIKSEEEKHP